MTVGLVVIEVHLSQARSLKEKRMVMSRLKGRIKSRLNVSVAEVDFQDLWQRGAIAIAAVGSARGVVEKTLQDAAAEIEREMPGEVVRVETEFLV